MACERDRKHRHYLKRSLRRHCGENLTLVKGKGKSGRIYDYLVCLGRKKGTGCKLPHLPVHEVEEKVAAAYERVKVRQLGEDATEADWRLPLEDVRAATTQALAGLRKLNEGRFAGIERASRRWKASARSSSKPSTLTPSRPTS